MLELGAQEGEEFGGVRPDGADVAEEGEVGRGRGDGVFGVVRGGFEVEVGEDLKGRHGFVCFLEVMLDVWVFVLEGVGAWRC